MSSRTRPKTPEPRQILARKKPNPFPRAPVTGCSSRPCRHPARDQPSRAGAVFNHFSRSRWPTPRSIFGAAEKKGSAPTLRVIEVDTTIMIPVSPRPLPPALLQRAQTNKPPRTPIPKNPMKKENPVKPPPPHRRANWSLSWTYATLRFSWNRDSDLDSHFLTWGPHFFNAASRATEGFAKCRRMWWRPPVRPPAVRASAHRPV